MGDRRMAEIKTSDGSLFLYSHWGGHSLPERAEKAIFAARGRWQDESYCVRILVDQLTIDHRDEETGAGLMLKPCCEDSYNNDDPSVIIDITEKTLTIEPEGTKTRFEDCS